MKIAVIGGGPSGMAAALAAAKAGNHTVILLERQARVGKKLSVTGNGRCNLTNTGGLDGHYHGDASFARAALEAFAPEKTLEWFRSMGLVTVTEPGGRVYPLSDQASTVVDVLRFALAESGVQVETGEEVSEIIKKKKGFELRFAPHEEGTSEPVFAHRVIAACGGAAGTKAGGGVWGYRLLKSLGHTASPLRPSLVQLKTEETLVRSLKGVRADCHVRMTRGEVLLAQSRGEVQFTEYGVSGPVIFEVSRFAEKGTRVHLDLMQNYGKEEIAALLLRRKYARPDLTLADLFTGTVHNRLGRVLVRYGGLRESDLLIQTPDSTVERLAGCVKDFCLTVTGSTGFDGAQVTAGGMCTGEFDPVTMESRLVPGLYACGEVLDVDGDCGGYNLQWAWSSGYAAGLHAGGAPC